MWMVHLNHLEPIIGMQGLQLPRRQARMSAHSAQVGCLFKKEMTLRVIAWKKRLKKNRTLWSRSISSSPGEIHAEWMDGVWKEEESHFSLTMSTPE